MKRQTLSEQESTTLRFAAQQAIDGVAADIKQLEVLMQRGTEEFAVEFVGRNTNSGQFIDWSDQQNLLGGAFSAAVVFENMARGSLADGELTFAIVGALNAQRAISRAAGAALGVSLSSEREIDVKAAAKIVAKHMNDAMHVNHRAVRDRVPELWQECLAKGMTKTAAAPLIAAEVHQTVKTVRRKLQGL